MMDTKPDEIVAQQGKSNMGVCLLQLLFVLHCIHSCVFVYSTEILCQNQCFMLSKMCRFLCCETRIKVLEYLLLGN